MIEDWPDDALTRAADALRDAMSAPAPGFGLRNWRQRPGRRAALPAWQASVCWTSGAVLTIGVFADTEDDALDAVRDRLAGIAAAPALVTVAPIDPPDARPLPRRIPGASGAISGLGDRPL